MHQVHSRPDGLTTADLVTGSRFVLAAVLAIAAIAGGPQWLVGTLAGTALLTDLVDGRLARATSTVTRLGARLDQEADAVLILVLSAIVAADLGPWVLGIGLARYAFGALFRVVPGLRIWLNLSSVSGRMDSQLDDDADAGDEPAGLSLTMRSVSGDMRIHRSAAASVA